jgi:hypothetical protein
LFCFETPFVCASRSACVFFFQSKLLGEAPGGASFANESIFIFTFSSSEDGVKIATIHDFVDTKQAADAAAARQR